MDMTKDQYVYWLKGYLSDKLSETQIATIVNTFNSVSDFNWNSLQGQIQATPGYSGPVTVPYTGPFNGTTNWPNSTVLCGGNTANMAGGVPTAQIGTGNAKLSTQR